MRRLRRAEPAAVSDTAEVDAATLRSRRRFARRQWRRRFLAWKWVIVLLLVIVLLCVAIWAAYFSRWLQVKGADIEGDHAMATPTLVEKFADVPVGDPLITADLAGVRLRILANLPVVKSVDVSREWPDRILIKITERKPVAVVSIGGRLRALDDTGAVFWHYAKAPAGLPRVTSSAGTDSEALSEAAKVAAALPADLARRVDHVAVATVDDISLSLRDGRTVVWGGAADSTTKAKVLVAVLKSNPDAGKYDVSVPGQPVVSPGR
ncbi:cell division protein FtsQ/DivIB [Nocardioides sp. DS6]|uniref:Cell division protein FtsQ/DivIB n=1 Tax=Nocardioides eburneus TaxID=3231482 RepID=A0ABV3SX21_9ACTN